ncbi:hypothetical protein H8E77_23575 [bacterium]|nr:hypothetical protein [bacterium]
MLGTQRRGSVRHFPLRDVVLSRWDGRGHGGTYNCIKQSNGKGVPVFDAGTLKQIGIHSPYRVGKYPHLVIPR